MLCETSSRVNPGEEVDPLRGATAKRSLTRGNLSRRLPGEHTYPTQGRCSERRRHLPGFPGRSVVRSIPVRKTTKTLVEQELLPLDRGRNERTWVPGKEAALCEERFPGQARPVRGAAAAPERSVGKPCPKCLRVPAAALTDSLSRAGPGRRSVATPKPFASMQVQKACLLQGGRDKYAGRRRPELFGNRGRLDAVRTRTTVPSERTGERTFVFFGRMKKI